MDNIWIKRRRTYSLPVTLNEDREIEFADVMGKDIPQLIEFWASHLRLGSLTAAEHRAISAILIYAIERQDADAGSEVEFSQPSHDIGRTK